MPFQRDDNEIGALWERTSAAGKSYMTGTVNGQQVVVFRATKKSEKSPDWRVMKSQPRGGGESFARDESRKVKQPARTTPPDWDSPDRDPRGY
jgi:uncharacterized protein (DUF736 family)